MTECRHCKVTYVTSAAHRNHCYEGFCSRYCFEAHKINLKPVDGRWPVQWLTCDVCKTRKSVKLDYYMHTRKNARFCSKDCYDRINKGRKRYRQFQFMLPLQLHPNRSFSAKELAQMNHTRMNASRSSRSVAGSLRVWAARGVIDYNETDRTYSYNHQTPLASEMIKYI